MKNTGWILNKDTNIVRGMSKGVTKLTRVVGPNKSNETSVELVTHVDFGGAKLPSFIVDYYARKNVRIVPLAQQYFQQLRKLHQYDETDGIAIGEVLMLKSKSEKENSKANSKKSKLQVRSARSTQHYVLPF